MFKLKPIITRREEKIIVKHLKVIENLKKRIKKEKEKGKVNEYTPLATSMIMMELSHRLDKVKAGLYEILKTIYLDK